MALVLHNTAARAKQVFEPRDPGHVRMYVCGPTVYDFAHVGNARPIVVFDVLYRLLRRLYPSVTYVRNITDIDDKIIDAAEATGEAIASITGRTTRAFHDDMAALNALPPDVEPQATEHIAPMIAMIEKLVASQNAYAADGHVLFHVASLAAYGALSGRSRDEMIDGARVEVAPYKRDAADFVLWKPSPAELPGWDSPWGRGRPGWHIECSAMSEAYLGTSFDIHGGGQDLIFPHHENEIAQSTCAHGGAPLATFWVHNGYVNVEGEKMSKSLSNIITVHDLLAEVPGEVIRLALLATHYRQPLDFTRESLRQARGVLDRWYRALGNESLSPEVVSAGVIEALEDDLNTPDAITRLHALADEVHAASEAERPAAQRELKSAGWFLGLLQGDADSWFRGRDGEMDKALIEDLIARRDAARAARDFAAADRIRDDLAERGIVLEDGPEGTTWRRAG